MNSRLIAARIVNAVINGASLADVLPKQIEKIQDERDSALIQAICYGVCRYYDRLDVVLSHLLEKPMREKDSDVYALLLVGLYQLMEMRIPEHAAVSETVNASQKLNKPWSRGFVNAILREYIRQQAKIAELIAEDEEATYSHPRWLIGKIKKAWPDHWQEILKANNAHPPFSLRVNDKLSLKSWAEENSLQLDLIDETRSGMILSPAMPVAAIPGFLTGDVSVQDGAAQLAAEWLMLEKHQRVLDACAAPGGKLMHILQLEPDLSGVVAVEKDKNRMLTIKENLSRMQPLEQNKVEIKVADAADLNAWWDGAPFDRILLDAPCSASGVIRRHPDIKLLRQPNDILVMAAEQKKILAALWQTLKPGGILLYATCSIFPEENVGVISHFLGSHQDAKEDKIQSIAAIHCEVGCQILPGINKMDGFYYARLVKKPF